MSQVNWAGPLTAYLGKFQPGFRDEKRLYKFHYYYYYYYYFPFSQKLTSRSSNSTRKQIEEKNNSNNWTGGRVTSKSLFIYLVCLLVMFFEPT